MLDVKISGANPALLSEMLEREKVDEIELVCELYLPDDRSRPVPGLVVCEGLGGLHESRERGYGRKLATEGYAVLVIDSFGSRGVGKNGDVIRAMSVTEAMMLSDAFTGLAWLAGRPDVDAARIGVIGFSYGGMIAVLASYEQLARVYLPDGPRFATHLSYYGCSIPRLDDPTTTGAPVKILLGDLDRNISIPRTDEIVADLRRGGSEVDLRVFEDVYHQWDGEDAKKRFVPFNLSRMRLRVEPDHGVCDERSGLRMKGRISRTSLITMWTDPRGYSILRDEDTTKRTDDILRESLQAM